MIMIGMVDLIMASVSFYFFKKSFVEFVDKIKGAKLGIAGAYLFLTAFLTLSLLLILRTFHLELRMFMIRIAIGLYLLIITASALVARAFTSLGRAVGEGTIGLGMWLWVIGLALPIHPMLNLILMVLGVVIAYSGLSKLELEKRV